MPTRGEIEFITMWRAVAEGLGPASPGDTEAWICDHPRCDGWTCWEDNLATGGHRSSWVLTPRGEDLVASAKGLDLTAITADEEIRPEWLPPKPNIFDPELVDCPACKGRGRIPITIDSSPTAGKAMGEYTIRVWDMGCDACSGSGKVPRSRFVKVGAATVRSGVQERGDDERQWSDLRPAEGLADLVEGQVDRFTDAVNWDPATLSPTPRQPGANPWSITYVGPGEIIEVKSKFADVQPLAAVKLDDWAREPEAIESLLREALETGREIDAEWAGGEDLKIERVTGVQAEQRSWWDIHVMGTNGGEDWWSFSLDPEQAGERDPILTAVRFK